MIDHIRLKARLFELQAERRKDVVDLTHFSGPSSKKRTQRAHPRSKGKTERYDDPVDAKGDAKAKTTLGLAGLSAILDVEMKMPLRVVATARAIIGQPT